MQKVVEFTYVPVVAMETLPVPHELAMLLRFHYRPNPTTDPPDHSVQSLTFGIHLSLLVQLRDKIDATLKAIGTPGDPMGRPGTH